MKKKKLISVIIVIIISLISYGYKNRHLLQKYLPQPEIKLDPNSTISIATFNIQVFGQSKRKKKDVVTVLVNLVQQFDITAIQEFRDKKKETIPFFLDQLNKSERKYKAVASKPLGRTASKERYAFIYDATKIEYLNQSYEFNDTKDWFQREPFIGHFKAGDFDFVLINIHTMPDEATKEIKHLDDVVEDARKRFPEEKDFIVLGDFNADGSYYDETTTGTDITDDYHWVVLNHFDTTVAKSDNTYDRIVICSETKEDYTGKVEVVRFDTLYNLTNKQAKAVSDHYPVRAYFHVNKDTQ